MTVASETNRSGPYNGNGVTTVFSYGFRIIDEDHLRVIKTSALGVETILTIATDYTVASVGNPAGGSITLLSAPATGETITILRAVPFVQETDLENQGAYYAETVEDALDLAVMRDQQLAEEIGRSIHVSAEIDGVDLQLPAPEAGKIISWNEDADGLQNLSPTELVSVVAYGTANADIFTGDGVQTVFGLSANPAALNNLDVAIGGVTQLPGADYTWTSGTNITFTAAPANGVKVLVRYMQALTLGTTADDLVSSDDGAGGSLWTHVKGFIAYLRSSVGSSIVGFIQAGTGTTARTAQDKMRDVINIKDFGAAFDVADDASIANATDDTAAWNAALTHLLAIGGGTLVLPPGASKVTAQIDIPTTVPIRIVGSGCRGVYPGVYAAGTAVPSTVVPVHSGRSAFRFLGTTAGDGSFYASDWNIATLETGTYPDSGFGWETGGGFLYGFSFTRMGVYGFKNSGVGEAFVIYKTTGSELAIGQLLIEDCCIHRNNWILKTLNSTQINGFKFVNNKAGQNGFSVGNGGISASGHDVAILDNILESNRDTIYLTGAFTDITIRGNYFEANVGRACIEVRDAISYNIGPNNYGMSLPFAAAGQDETTGAYLAHKVLLTYCEMGICTDPYWPSGRHKGTQPLIGNTVKQNLNGNLDRAYPFWMVDSLQGSSFATVPSYTARTLQLPTSIVRESNPLTGLAMPVQQYTTTGTGIVTVSYTISGSVGEWLVMSWLLKRMPDAGAVVDPYIVFKEDGTTPRTDYPIYHYDHCWVEGEWSLITAAVKLTETMTSVTFDLYPHGMSPAAGRVSRFLRPVVYTVDDVNKIMPYIDQLVVADMSAAPTTGTWLTGDIINNSNPSVDGNNMVLLGWICTTAGTPGTWSAMRTSTVSPAT